MLSQVPGCTHFCRENGVGFERLRALLGTLGAWAEMLAAIATKVANPIPT
jgi:hypothetical protein